MVDLVGREHVHHVPPTAEEDQRAPQLGATIIHESDGVAVHVTGEMDLASAPGFERQTRSLFALPVHSVTLDLAGLQFIDSSGLSALVAIHAAAQEHRVALTLRSVPSQARLVMDLTHLAHLFTTED